MRALSRMTPAFFIFISLNPAFAQHGDYTLREPEERWTSVLSRDAKDRHLLFFQSCMLQHLPPEGVTASGGSIAGGAVCPSEFELQPQPELELPAGWVGIHRVATRRTEDEQLQYARAMIDYRRRCYDVANRTEWNSPSDCPNDVDGSTESLCRDVFSFGNPVSNSICMRYRSIATTDPRSYVASALNFVFNELPTRVRNLFTEDDISRDLPRTIPAEVISGGHNKERLPADAGDAAEDD